MTLLVPSPLWLMAGTMTEINADIVVSWENFDQK